MQSFAASAHRSSLPYAAARPVRKRERSPEREAPKKKRGWDDMGADPANAALLLQQQQAFTMMQTQQMPSMPGSKKQRELYVGQLGQEQP